MNSLLFDFNVIVIFIVFAQFSNSINVYIIDTEGHMTKLSKPIHVDEEHTPKSMRDRFAIQLAEFLQSKKQRHTNIKINFNKSKQNKRSRSHSSESKYTKSPVVFSNGRYTLDLDKIDVQDETGDSNKNKNNNEYFDQAESLRDYYDFMNAQNRIKLHNKIRPKRHHSLRKHSEKSNTVQDSSSSDYVTIFRDGKKSIVKRFQIVGNTSKGKKKKKVQPFSDSDSSRSSEEAPKKKMPKSSSENDRTMSREVVDNSFSDEKKKGSSEESYEYDDDELYLQGNQIIPLKGKDDIDKTKRSSLESTDGRRRLPHFLPKRFHWNPDDIKHLGYFWFNGPRGKYPEATPL